MYVQNVRTTMGVMISQWKLQLCPSHAFQTAVMACSLHELGGCLQKSHQGHSGLNGLVSSRDLEVESSSGTSLEVSQATNTDSFCHLTPPLRYLASVHRQHVKAKWPTSFCSQSIRRHEVAEGSPGKTASRDIHVILSGIVYAVREFL